MLLDSESLSLHAERPLSPSSPAAQTTESQITSFVLPQDMGRAEPSGAQKHRTSNINGYSNLPEVDTRSRADFDGKEVRPHHGKETVLWDIGGKEAAPSQEKRAFGASGLEVIDTDDKELVQTTDVRSDKYSAGDENHAERSRQRRKRRTWILLGIALIVVIGVALGVGLGIGMQSSDEKAGSGEPAKSTITTPASSATGRGAMKGSAISVRSQHDLLNLTSGVEGASERDGKNLLLVFQHHTGDVRWMQRVWPDTWQGGSEKESITSDAKNGTPIATLAIDDAAGGSTEWHVFFVDSENKLREQVIDNVTSTWHAGLLEDLDISTLDADKIGLATCYYNGPIASTAYNESAGAGIRLWVAIGETTFKQYSWQPGMSSWADEQQFEGLDGRARPTCDGRTPGSVTYVMFVDENKQVAFYWNDHGEDNNNDESHPVGSWVKASLSIPAVNPMAGLSFGYGANLYARTSDNGPILGWNITFDAEDTGISGGGLSQVSGNSIISESSIETWAVLDAAVMVFAQTEGDDITAFSGDVESGEWATTVLPIPDD